MSSTIIGIFQDERHAQEAADDLKQEGFSGSDIHISDREHRHHGGFVAWMERLFGAESPEDESAEYRRAIDQGRAIVAVDADDEEIDHAARILQRHGAVDIDGDQQHTEYTSTRGTQSGSRSIPVVEEDVNVGKRIVIGGGVRVYSHVTETPVEEEVRLREEKVRVERRPVNRPVQPGDETALRDQTIEMAETREEPVVRKTQRVVEEVVIGKEATERTEKVRDNVRKTDVQVEPLAGEQTRSASKIPNECALDFRKNYETHFASLGGAYSDYEPSYDYGYRMASDARYRGKRWEDVEPNLRRDYGQSYPNSSWERMKEAVRYGWERMTGKR
jgi:stress response protein YsnF